MLTNIVDGWILNPSIKYLPYRSIAMLLGQMEPLRRAHNYRERIWVVPDDLRTVIPARGQLNRQIRVVQNSILWGATFNRFTVEGGHFTGVVAPTNMALQITDDATGCQFGSEFVFAASLFPRKDVSPTGITLDSGSTPCLLTQPRLFVKPGLLSVEIANVDTVDVNCQLCLYFSEPCELVDRGSQCP